MSEPRRRLVTRLLTVYTLAFLGLVGLLGVMVDRTIGSLVEERQIAVRWAFTSWALLAGAVGAVLVWLFARKMARPLGAVADTAEAIAAGRLEARAPRTGTIEFDRLGLAINNVATELGRRVASSEEERQLLEQVLAVVRQGIVVVGEDDVIGYANPAARELIRVSDNLRTLTPHSFQRMVREARSRQSVVQEDLEHGQPVRLLRVVATPFPSDRRVLLAFIDVTDARRVEAVRRDFVAAASHELKTPVAAILASSHALQLALEKNDAAAQRFAGQVERSAGQLARLVTDLLDLSRLESLSGEPESVQLDEVVAEEIRRIQTIAEQAGLKVESQLQPAVVMGSRADLGLAVRNLLDNAVRHTPAGGSVDIRVNGQNGDVAVEVTDTGEGIPRRELPRIFERFYRVDTARARATGGTGLGLAIVKHVAERHGGTVSAESELGVGSKFVLRLPVRDN
jgi:signal transduction histidine kinase/HAMP domain-containing protein